MNDYDRVNIMRDRWLVPPTPTSGKNKCGICGEKTAYIPYFQLEFGLICDECRAARRKSFDSYPELEEYHYVCRDCGDLCEGAVTIIDKDAYCDTCMQEASI